MVKRTLLILLSLLTVESYGAVYQINIVKKVEKQPSFKEFFIYKVKRGDALLKILKKFHIPRRFLYKIAKLNRIKNPNLIYAGQLIKLPTTVPAKSSKLYFRKKVSPDYKVGLIEKLGVRVNRSGTIFVGDKAIDLRQNPLIKFKNSEILVNFGNLSRKLVESLKSLGIRVINPADLDRLIDQIVSSSFHQVYKNGKLVLGEKDVLTYRYDYLVYDSSSGNLVVINKEPDTPLPLKGLLNAYGVSVLEPKKAEEDPSEGWGEVKVLSGSGIEKLEELVELLKGVKVKPIPDGFLIPENHLAVVYDSVTPEERVRLEIQGYKVFVLTGNFIYDAEKVLDSILVANKLVTLVLVEPPGTEGKRARFTKEGLLITLPNKTWFLVDSVEREEEISYLRYKGVNLIFY